MDTYTSAYIRLIEQARYCRLLPWPLKCRLGAWLGRRGSFLLQRKEQIVGSMQQALDMDRESASSHFRRLCESSGVAMQMAWQLADTSGLWLQRYVQTAQPDILQSIAETGAVVLSHHSYHQNLLISFFKTVGPAVFPIGNPPTAFSSDDYLYHFTTRLNQATATNLNGGNWLFNNQGRNFLLGIRQVIESRQILMLFCDFNEARKSNPVMPFLGKTLQIPGGVLRLLEKEDIPVYFAGFYLQPHGMYQVHFEPLRAEAAVEDGGVPLAQRYLHALERHIRRYPSAWQCWEIF